MASIKGLFGQTNLSSKFKGLKISDKVANTSGTLDTDIHSDSSETEFLDSIINLLQRRIKSNCVRHKQSDMSVKTNIEVYIEKTYISFPCKKIIFELINRFHVPEYPSMYLLPIIHIIISDHNEEISSVYKELILNKTKNSQLMSNSEDLSMCETAKQAPEEKWDYDVKKFVIALQQSINYIDLIHNNFKNGTLEARDRETLTKVLNVITNFYNLDLSHSEHREVFINNLSLIRNITMQCTDRKWHYFFDSIYNNLME